MSPGDGTLERAGELKPPYYAVIFTSRQVPAPDGYFEMAERMVELARTQPGFLGIESAREGAFGITVSYWDSLWAIDRWREHAEHRVAQGLGREEWYEAYDIRVARVERSISYGSSLDRRRPR